MQKTFGVLKTAVGGFFEHDAFSRAAAIAFFAVTSLAPVLLVVVAVAGAVFGRDVARASVSSQLTGLVGSQGADFIKSVLESSSDPASSIVATIVGIVTILFAASGVFGEMHTALNKVWQDDSVRAPILSLLRTRVTSLGLVAALGFLLIVSLSASAALSALSGYIQAASAYAGVILSMLNTLVSVAIFTLLFAAIYKALPDRSIAWRDVIVGAFVTALMFTAGKSLIGWYLGRAAINSSYGAAGSLIVLMLWLYYSALIFLFGAELTKSIADRKEIGGTR